jgi:ABC-type multidrug transport system fused ATPase/permease subunit
VVFHPAPAGLVLVGKTGLNLRPLTPLDDTQERATLLFGPRSASRPGPALCSWCRVVVCVVVTAVVSWRGLGPGPYSPPSLCPGQVPRRGGRRPTCGLVRRYHSLTMGHKPAQLICCAMLKRLHLSQYKAFEKFDITFRSGQNILVGPNNAGKSTIIAALRLCALLMRQCPED